TRAREGAREEAAAHPGASDLGACSQGRPASRGDPRAEWLCDRRSPGRIAARDRRGGGPPRGRASVKIALLDVNVLIALLWPAHQHHEAAHAWIERRGRAR